MSERLLIADGNSTLRESLSNYLQKEGFIVDCASNFQQALNIYASYIHDLAIIEIELPDGDGIELASKIKILNPNAKIILTTSYPSISTALKAIKIKVEDYLIKPFVYDEIKLSLKKLIKPSIVEEPKEKIPTFKEKEELCAIIGESVEIKLLFEKIRKIANTPTNVLLLGETGTGKELFARAIHEASYRRKKPFVAINCASLPENLLESELFGFIKGAFTGAASDKKGLLEIADGGTVFLDEIGDLPLSLQAKLLRVLEDREIRPLGSVISKKVDLRFISATNKDLIEEVKEGKFREDLFFRLNVITLSIPPLRERGRDIEILAHHFMRKFAIKMGKNLKKIDSQALKLLYKHPWPGNIRELQNVIEQAVVFCETDTIMPEDLPEYIQHPEKFFDRAKEIPVLSIEEYTKEFILKYQSIYTEQELADMLGITRKALWEKRKKWGIPRSA
ncbi:MULTISPECIES: sigma-54-dependent transcriptional regulator [Thermodesulfovibrio]|jgi:DNA-binding NtrC family response regulator|uniref:Acetoacetate metabolism regulatory protein AtoC n=2 Tax=Thermodesulfovibrio yellowstonii TaxID=28262 RepID=B5YGW3_THEYD|nr:MULTISPECIES: sigma-54 dependent transcriptional regulator [Thermodesulfovibrio]ACI21124.1 acetoacetate metabolism regulatory protein AtoC [Thermodesulfovibrio yellowstonii DSM 11347]MDI6865416.1 sigma-54 dependent transcriptional regulator [Thermodesulfovibrio yellowstonii]GLI52569.1 acetoacetate metabolism regulatory protein AtoC [Thermodesulfovibrio islandicus]